jgi:hypothetical protein
LALSLNNFLELSKPWEYDFKNEYPWDEDMPTQIDSISLFLKYKATQPGFDCDCCDLANEIYALLWECSPISGRDRWSPRYSLGVMEDAVNSVVKSYSGEILFDKKSLERETMNSFKTTYDQAIKIEIKEHPNIRLRDYQNKFGWIDIQKFKNDHPDILEKVDANKELQKFACLTHSIGNFTMLINPSLLNYEIGFNIGRYTPTKDYWDLSLDLLRKELGNDELYAAYIKAFCLEECVDASYNAVPLFTRATSPDMPKPQTSSELDEFLTNVNNRITARGKQIVSLLRELLKDK